MNGFARLMIAGMIVLMVACASRQTDEEILPEGDNTTQNPAPADSPQAGQNDEFSEFNDGSAPQAEAATPSPTDEPKAEPLPGLPSEPTENAATTPAEPSPPPEAEPTPLPEVHSPPVQIVDLKFKPNETGGTVIVEGSGPLTYTTRSNPETKQFVVEIPNSKLPSKLKRSLNTRDIEGLVGAIDAYQTPGSNTSRIVIQLRDGAVEPAVQAEGQRLLIVASAGKTENGEPITSVNGLNQDLGDDKILLSQSLQEFLSGNQKFYGNPISIEMDNVEVKDALKFISAESGLNMIIAEEISGKVNLKLQNVPWDQALVVLLRAKRLGYTRQGSVLRIATLDDLKKEEEDATKLAKEKRIVEPLRVRVFPINYAKVEDLKTNLTTFLSERGKVVADVRTNSVIVTDVADGVARVEKLLQSLDVQPPQVMIEGKIVEASESFRRQLGVAWSATGTTITLGGGRSGPITLTPSLSVSPGGAIAGGNYFTGGIRLGVLDFLGDLDATLKLSENENTVKIISSPRVVTLTNETAKINQTTQIPITTVTTTALSESRSITFKPLEMNLEVTPQITSEGSVLMKVSVKREVQGGGTTGTTDIAINGRSADTRVLVKNGQTTVIGGIYQSDLLDIEDRIPGLSDIPYFGRLFKSTEKRKEKVEMLIFLTPRILDAGQMGRSSQSQN